MSYNTPKDYAIGAASSDIPAAWMPSSEPRVQSGGSHRIVSVASQNGTVSSGQQLSFQLPANLGAGFLVSSSAYIRMTVTVTQTQIAGVNAWAFRQYGSAHSMFLRMSALLSGSLAEQIQNYNKLCSSLTLHASNAEFVSNDDSLAQGTMSGFTPTQSLTVCVPVNLGLFNAKCHLPLFLLSQCQLQVDLESAAQAFTSGSANAVTEYQISNANLVFEQLVPDSVYEQGVKQMLASRVYQIPINTWYNLKLANQAVITQNIGLSSSSVKGVFWNVVTANGSRQSGAFTSDGQTSAYLYLDGQLVSNSNLAIAPEQFLEMNRALNILSDVERTSWAPSAVNADSTAADFTVAPITRALYSNGAYLGGLSCSRSHQDGFSFSGSPVNTAVLQVGTANTAGTFYIYCALQQVVTIDVASNVNLIR